jgi:hypothetical protein
MENGCRPNIVKFFENLNDEDAFEKEKQLIEHHKRVKDGGTLLNKSKYKGGNTLGEKSGPWNYDKRNKFRELCKTTRKYDPTYEELYDEFIVQNMTRKSIAERYNVSEVLVKKRLKHFGIKKPKELLLRQSSYICPNCNVQFSLPRSTKNRICCSLVCRTEYGEKKRNSHASKTN